MTAVDWIIIGFTVLMALWGYMQGLVVGALSLVGFAGGAFAGSRLAPLLLAEGAESPYAPLFTLMGAFLLGGVVAAVLGELGTNIRRRIRFVSVAMLDGIGGAVLIAALGLGLAWIGGAVALQTPGAREFRKDIQRSVILRELNGLLPPSGPILNALARVDPFPRIEGPGADVAAPGREILADPDVEAARASVVRILGTACGLGVQGSGWIAGPATVVTNAHVVAGQNDTTVQLDGGAQLGARAVAFDARNDVAVLQVPGLGAPALRQVSPAEVGSPVAILGYPENGPYDSEPGRLGATQAVISEDAYGAGPVQRRMTALRGEIRSGNSGGPAVDAAGRVVATVFASAEGATRGGFGVPPEIVADDLRRTTGPVGTGSCAG